MIVTVWLSGENEALARAELAATAERLRGGPIEISAGDLGPGRGVVELPDRSAALELAGRLALAHRCAEAWPGNRPETLEPGLRRRGSDGSSAAFQWISGSGSIRPPELLRRFGDQYRLGGGSIDLKTPDHRFWLEPLPGDRIRLFEEVGSFHRSTFADRRMQRFPFQRPVTLDPRLARALVNLAHVGPGDRVVDPFVGTGSLLLEAALLGASTVGVDASATMVRGALENFNHLGQTPELLRQADASEAAMEFPPASFDALVTDPPYGRASGTRGERPELLWNRVLRAWTDKVKPGGRLAVIVPAGGPAPELDARLELAIPQRVHRSLTREFRVYLRS